MGSSRGRNRASRCRTQPSRSQQRGSNIEAVDSQKRRTKRAAPAKPGRRPNGLVAVPRLFVECEVETLGLVFVVDA